MYSITSICDREYKGERSHSLKVRLENIRKAVLRDETTKSGMTFHVWREMSSQRTQWKEMKILEHWRIRRLKVSAHMLRYNDLPNRVSLEFFTLTPNSLF